MVSDLDSEVNALGSKTGRGHCCVVLFGLLPLSTQAYKWVAANLLLPGGGIEILQVASYYWNRDFGFLMYISYCYSCYKYLVLVQVTPQGLATAHTKIIEFCVL